MHKTFLFYEYDNNTVFTKWVRKWKLTLTSIGSGTSQADLTTLIDFIFKTSLANWEIALMTSHKHLPISINSNLFTTRVAEVSTGFHHLWFWSFGSLSQCMLWWNFIWKSINSWRVVSDVKGVEGDGNAVESFSEVRRLVSLVV